MCQKTMISSMDNMQETIEVIQKDFTLLFIIAIAIVVLLVIVLVVVVSTMRVKRYKNRFLYEEAEHKIKVKYISELEKELEEYKIKNASNKQELQQFEETKIALKSSNESLVQLQNRFNELEKELSQTKAKLEAMENNFRTLEKEHKLLQERQNELLEKSSKYRITNARLLTKLETYERSS